MRVGEALTLHVNETIAAIEKRYFGNFINSRITFKKEAKGVRFTCTIRLTCAHGAAYTSNTQHSSAYHSFNQAADHIASQIRKAKTALNDDKPINAAKSIFLDKE
jgi:ribosomal subunit interface protein